jgi:hypothetical protein
MNEEAEQRRGIKDGVKDSAGCWNRGKPCTFHPCNAARRQLCFSDMILWQSSLEGLKVFAHWETYIVGIIMTFVIAGPKLFLVLLRDRHMYDDISGGEVRMGPALIFALIRHHWIYNFKKLREDAVKGRFAGGFKGILLIGAAEFAGGYIGIVTLLPIMLQTGNASWALPWIMPFTATLSFLKIVGWLLLGILAVNQIPLIGEMFIFPMMVVVMVRELGLTAQLVIPDFWICISFLLIGVIIKYIAIYIGAFITAFLPAEIVVGNIGQRLGLAVFCLLPLGNMLTGFLYAGWLVIKLKTA